MAVRKRARKGHKDLGDGPCCNIKQNGKIYHPVSMYITSGDAKSLAKKVRENDGRAIIKKSSGLKTNKRGYAKRTTKYAVFARA